MCSFGTQYALRGPLRGARCQLARPLWHHRGEGPCADWRQLPLLQRTALRNGGENEIPCPMFSISYIGRKDQSVMAAAAYNAGEKMYSERDHEWKHPRSSPERAIYREVMLPDNAPREYADSQTLWNAVDAAEKRKDAQTARRMLIVLPKELTYEQNLALIRDYCQQEFVSKGMICDLYYHDEHDGNPHVICSTTVMGLATPLFQIVCLILSILFFSSPVINAVRSFFHY